MILLSGKTIKEKIKEDIKRAISVLSFSPRLVIIQVGNNSESETYIKQKKIFGESVGATVTHASYAADISEEDLIHEIEKCNIDASVHGIIVQLPLPSSEKSRNTQRILDSIAPQKDVDGLGKMQCGMLYTDTEGRYVPATVRGILTLCDYYDISLAGKHVVVVGRSNLVGKPAALMCMSRNATVTVCHSHTVNLKDITLSADILIVACGVRGLITEEYVREGQVLIDVGIHTTDVGLQGDVDFESVKDIVSAITPVPGGVGPLTVVSLFQNLLDACNTPNFHTS